MNKLMKLGRAALVLALVLSLSLGLCLNGLTVFAQSTELESQKDTILKEFFGDGVTTEEAFDILLEKTKEMEDYENLQYQYVPNENSYYVALGDETAVKAKKLKSSYVDELAAELGVSYKNLAASQMEIQDVYDTITDNSSDIAKADLITLGWSNYGATYYMCQYMAGQTDRVTEKEWTDLVGEENMPMLEELLDLMFQKLRDENLSNFDGYDLEGGLECYAYAYMSNALHQSQVIEAIRVINQTAVIVLVGTYNDLEGVALEVDGSAADLGDMMQDLVNASNLLATKNAAAYSRVAYVHAPDVSTTLDANAANYTTPQQYVFAIVGRQGLPNADGHTYIANQIKSVFSEECCHFWDEGTVTAEPTCGKDGETTYVCTWCGEKTTETIEKTGEHTWDEGVVTKKPTATTDGEMTYTCEGCGETRTEVIEKTGESDVLLGDANGDGKVNARDARALLRFIAGLTEESEIDQIAADYNGDGKINARDARAILRHIAGLE